MSKTELPSRILVVDDDPSVGRSIEHLLAQYKVQVQCAASLESAMYMFNQSRFDATLIELEFAPLPGLALVQKWREHEDYEHRMTGFILMSGQRRSGEEENLIKELGDVEVIQKPFSLVHILPYLARAVVRKTWAMQYHDLKERIVAHFVKTGDFNKAADIVKAKLPTLGPKGLEMLYELYEKGGRLEEALQLVSGMLAKNSGDISLLNAKGRLLLRLGRAAEAQPFLERADQMAPQNIQRITEMATMFLHLNKPDASVQKFKEILNLTPENTDVKFGMFQALTDFGYDEHAKSFCKETTMPTEIVRYYNNKGVMASKNGDNAGAIREYTNAVRFFPKFKENYRIYFNLALAHTRMKTEEDYAKARDYLSQCLDLEPTFEKAKTALHALTNQNRKAAG